jgi:hypothetical protein
MRGGDLSRDKRVGGIVSNLWDPYLFVVMGSLPSLSPQRTRSPAPPVRGFFFFLCSAACLPNSQRTLSRPRLDGCGAHREVAS